MEFILRWAKLIKESNRKAETRHNVKVVMS